MTDSFLDENGTVLISSSNDERRNELQMLLHNMNINHIMVTSSMKDALHKTFEHRPFVVIIDASDNDIDVGLFSELIRQYPSRVDLWLILIVNIGDSMQRTRAFAGGADEVIYIPLIKEEIESRFANCMQHKTLRNQLKRANQLFKNEMEEAKRMQESLLPEPEMLEHIRSKYGITIGFHVQPSAILGGDMWGVTILNDHQLAIYTVDFSGHGVMAAINTFRLHAILQEHPNKGCDPGAYLEQLDSLMRKLLPKGNFATMFYGICDIERNVLDYACAAAPSSPVWYKNEEKAHVLDGAGFPLGITQSAHYKTNTIPFPKETTLMLYSDALFETEDNHGMYFTEDKIHSYMAPLVSGDLKIETQQALKLLTQHFQGHFGRQLQDDLTICLFQRS